MQNQLFSIQQSPRSYRITPFTVLQVERPTQALLAEQPMSAGPMIFIVSSLFTVVVFFLEDLGQNLGDRHRSFLVVLHLWEEDNIADIVLVGQ